MAINEQEYVDITSNVIGGQGGGGSATGPIISSTWGGIEGDIENQTDLIALVSSAIDTAVSEAEQNTSAAIVSLKQEDDPFPQYSQLFTAPAFDDFPATGIDKIIYIAEDTNKIFIWRNTEYVELSPGGGSSASYDTVLVSATTVGIRSAPTLVSGFTCIASASGNITIYDNIANSGTVIWSGAVTQGQVVIFPSPYQAYIGVSLLLNSGTMSINLSVK